MSSLYYNQKTSIQFVEASFLQFSLHIKLVPYNNDLLYIVI